MLQRTTGTSREGDPATLAEGVTQHLVMAHGWARPVAEQFVKRQVKL
jgi:hypothetical protein